MELDVVLALRDLTFSWKRQMINKLVNTKQGNFNHSKCYKDNKPRNMIGIAWLWRGAPNGVTLNKEASLSRWHVDHVRMMRRSQSWEDGGAVPGCGISMCKGPVVEGLSSGCQSSCEAESEPDKLPNKQSPSPGTP